MCDDLLQCKFRPDVEKSPGRYACTHPSLSVSASGVTLEFCRECPYRNRDPVFKRPKEEYTDDQKKKLEQDRLLHGLDKQQVKSFLTWLGDEASKGVRIVKAYNRWWRAGRPVPTQEQLMERIAACERCPHLQGRGSPEAKCGLCGCPIGRSGLLFGSAKRPGKAEMSTEVCPDNPPRWRSLL